MFVVRVEHHVPDYERWKGMFDEDPADRKGSGVLGYRIHRALDDSNYVMIDLDFAKHDVAEAFVEKLRGVWQRPQTAEALGGIPQARVVETVEGKEL